MAEHEEAPAGEAGAPANDSGEKSTTKPTGSRWGYEGPVEVARWVLEHHLRAAEKGKARDLSPGVIRAGVIFAEADPVNWRLLLGRLQRPAKGQALDLEQAVALRLTVRLAPLAGRQAQSVRWAWKGRVPLKAVTLVVGEPGQGKSTVIVDLVADVTNGTLDGDLRGTPSAVVICSAEDPVDEVLVPRLTAAGADLSRVLTVYLAGALAHDGLALPRDLDALRFRIEEARARVLVVDPAMAYIPTGIDSHKDQHVRRVLRPLAQMAEDLNVAVIAVMHLNKNETAKVLNRVGGSIGFAASARSVLLLGMDPESEQDDGTRVLAHAKSNFSTLAPSLGLRIVGASVEAEDGSEIPISTLDWLGECDVQAGDLVAPSPTREESRTVCDEATAWIIATLANGPVDAAQMLTEGTKQIGCGKRTLNKAKSNAGASSRKEGDRWVWFMPGADGPTPGIE